MHHSIQQLTQQSLLNVSMQRYVRSRFLWALVLFSAIVTFLNVYWFSQTRSREVSPWIKENSSTTPEAILQILQPLARRSRKAHNQTASSILVRGIVDHQFANRLGNSPHQTALKIRRAFEQYPLLPCWLEKDLLNTSTFRNTSLFFAAAVRNAEHIMPNLIVQVCRLALRLRREKLFVSIYESSSHDRTPQWLLVLKELLDLLRCPNSVVIFGAVRPKEGEYSTAFYARLRNAALQPLLRYQKNDFDKVVMVDDVFFCAQQVLRLHGLDVDMACAMDYVEAPPKRKWWPTSKPGPPLLTFRDVWSSIDITGRHFNALPPFVLDAYGRGLLYKGKPFPVHSCSNGLRVMKTQPFFGDIVFRGRPSGSCPASENVLLCQDFAQAGFQQIVIDPGVKVGHVYRDAVHVHHRESNGDVPFVPFADIEFPIAFPHHPSEVECCERLTQVDYRLKFRVCRKEHLSIRKNRT